MNSSMEESQIIRSIRQKIRYKIDSNISNTLYLINAQLIELPADLFADCCKIHWIYLNFNQLTKLPANLFTGCSQLQVINFAYNSLCELPVDIFMGCSQLQYINLSNNKLTKLPTGLFTGCSKVRNISLDGNPLTELPVDLFAGCTQLQYIVINKSLIYHLLWSLPDLDKDITINFCDSGYQIEFNYVKLYNLYTECALVKRWRRVANDPRSYAWSGRMYVIIAKNI